MNRMKSLWAIPAFTLALAACSGEIDNPRPDGRVALNVQAEIGSVATRATTTAFQANDAIGIIPVKGTEVEEAQANVKYVHNGTAFAAAATPYYFQNQDNVTFRAYYPYAEGLAAGTDGQYAIDIDTRADKQTTVKMNEADPTDTRTWRQNDYLTASAETHVGDPKVKYTFAHAMAQLQLVFKAGTSAGVSDLAQADDADPALSGLRGYILTTPLSVEGTFSPVAGEAKPNAAEKEPLTMTFSVKRGANDAAVTEYTPTALILLPQKVEGGELGLTLTYNGVPYAATLTAPADGFAAGSRYTYNVTVTNTGLTVGTVEIKDWADAELPDGTGEVDATIPPAPHVGDYYYSDGTFSTDYDDRKQVVGLVFYAGHHPNDNSDYSATGIKQKECHGYVMALTDAMGGRYFGTGMILGEEYAGTETADDRESAKNVWSGYYNTEQIKAFAEAKGHDDLSKFPAAEACVEYYKTGVYAAPKASSGWFLPAAGQLWEISSQETALRKSLDKIPFGGVDSGVQWLYKRNGYHSSTEKSQDPTNVWGMYYDVEGLIPSYTQKGYFDRLVRPILAF